VQKWEACCARCLCLLLLGQRRRPLTVRGFARLRRNSLCGAVAGA